MRIFALSALALLSLAAFAAPPAAAAPKCFSQVDDLITDGGTTYCVDATGSCKVSESTEYIWGREDSCVVGSPTTTACTLHPVDKGTMVCVNTANSACLVAIYNVDGPNSSKTCVGA